MRVVNIAPRRRLRVAVTLSPPPKADILGAEYEGENLLIDKEIARRCEIVVGTDSQMLKKGYINDERFAKRLISSCVAKNMSERQISEKLFQNGISAEVSNSLLKENENISKTELCRALELIRSKYKNKIGDENSRKKDFV